MTEESQAEEQVLPPSKRLKHFQPGETELSSGDPEGDASHPRDLSKESASAAIEEENVRQGSPRHSPACSEGHGESSAGDAKDASYVEEDAHEERYARDESLKRKRAYEEDEGREARASDDGSEREEAASRRDDDIAPRRRRSESEDEDRRGEEDNQREERAREVSPRSSRGEAGENGNDGPSRRDYREYRDDRLPPEVNTALEDLYDKMIFEPKDIDDRIKDFLASVPIDAALAALDDIQHRDFSTVRNKPAFIMSIFKRVTSGAPRGYGGHPHGPRHGGYDRYGPPPPYHNQHLGPSFVPPSALAHLPPAVSDMLQRVFASGVCHPSQFDDRAMDILVSLREDHAVRALSEFASMDPRRVRNPSAFWMGLARKHKSGMGNVYDGHNTRGAPLSYGAMHPYDSPGRVSGSRGLGPNYTRIDQRIDELIAMRQLRPGVLDDRARDALLQLREDDALAVLDEVLRDPGRVRNVSAYVMGLCRKFASSGEVRSFGRSGGHGPPRGGGYGPTTREMIDSLDPSVRERYMAMVHDELIAEGSFDARAFSALKAMRSEEACASLEELAASDPRRIHNVSAYFMGLAKKFSSRHVV